MTYYAKGKAFTKNYTQNNLDLMNHKIKLNFVNFDGGFEKCPLEENRFYQILNKFFNIEISNSPDFIIYLGSNNKRYLDYNCTRIVFENEYEEPNFALCDYAMNFSYLDDPRHLRLPYYFYFTDGSDLIKNEKPEKILAEKKKFCNFVFSNSSRRAQFRVTFLKELLQKKHVDCGGKILNNMDKLVEDKVAFCKDYKFTIAMENKSRVGYTTEKILHAMQARSIPIYWGNLAINDEFNPKSFINVQKFANTDAAIAHILDVDRHDDLYLEYAKEPYFYNNEPNEYLSAERVASFFDRVFTYPAKKRLFFPIRKVWDKVL